MFYFIGFILGVAVGYRSSYSSSDDPSISDIEKAYDNHKNHEPNPPSRPIMYQKQKYFDRYHDKMVEFINEMMIEENDGYNPLLMSLS